jgi:hypothetical protein
MQTQRYIAPTIYKRHSPAFDRSDTTVGSDVSGKHRTEVSRTAPPAPNRARAEEFLVRVGFSRLSASARPYSAASISEVNSAWPETFGW